MLEHRPVVKERLLACAVFGAIAVGVVAASDVLVTGGFDFPATARNAHADTPNYFQIATNDWNSDSRSPRVETLEIGWTEATPSEAERASYEAGDLVGDADDADVPWSASREPSEEELRREIAEMYAALPSAEAEYEAYDNSAGEDVYSDTAEKDASAYGNASPW